MYSGISQIVNMNDLRTLICTQHLKCNFVQRKFQSHMNMSFDYLFFISH